MKIIALYKVWSGEEWLEPSVLSILPYVHKIVLLTSNISWIGGKNNPSLPIISNLIAKYRNQILHINHDEIDQIKHCQYGYDYIRRNIPCDYIQLIDSDEVFSKKDFEIIIDFLSKNTKHNIIKINMFTYIKSPFYRIDPIEPLKPICFINAKKIIDLGKSSRACSLRPIFTIPDAYFHHFVFVRHSFNKVLEKLIQSHISENQLYYNMNKWIPEVWNKLPDYNREMFPTGFHPAIGFCSNWKNIRKITLDELPVILRNYPPIFNYGND